MTQYFPIVIEQESNGTFSAWVAGLPGVYVAAVPLRPPSGAFAVRWPPTSTHCAHSAANRS